MLQGDFAGLSPPRPPHLPTNLGFLLSFFFFFFFFLFFVLFRPDASPMTTSRRTKRRVTSTAAKRWRALRRVSARAVPALVQQPPSPRCLARLLPPPRPRSPPLLQTHCQGQMTLRQGRWERARGKTHRCQHKAGFLLLKAFRGGERGAW